MILVDIQNQRDIGVELQEGIHKLAASARAANRFELAAQKTAEVLAALQKDLGKHGGRCSLAVSARNADGVIIPACDQAQ